MELLGVACGVIDLRGVACGVEKRLPRTQPMQCFVCGNLHVKRCVMALHNGLNVGQGACVNA